MCCLSVECISVNFILLICNLKLLTKTNGKQTQAEETLDTQMQRLMKEKEKRKYMTICFALVCVRTPPPQGERKNHHHRFVFLFSFFFSFFFLFFRSCLLFSILSFFIASTNTGNLQLLIMSSSLSFSLVFLCFLPLQNEHEKMKLYIFY